MSFIGVITDEKNEIYMKKKLQKLLGIIDREVIIINESNIQNIKNVRFETILLGGNYNNIIENIETLKNMISYCKYLVVNVDTDYNLQMISDMDLKVITYGFNRKSTITISSVKEDNMMICIQRQIEDIYGNIIEPQESKVNICRDLEYSPSFVMGVCSVLLVYGIKDINL